MKLLVSTGLALLTLGAGALAADHPALAASALVQERSFGTIANGSTVCVGPLSPGTDPGGQQPGVQISGFTNGQPSLTWQVFSVSSQSAPTLVFQTTARNVDHVVPPSGNLLFHACVVKRAQGSQDYDLALNSFPVE
ncbi:hypothetical protein [Actinoplanes sp. NPDC049681]|uniref:hypothetical protein n=1 Tax=Actinoplanes sp. NPDC049681 TaxID=3363905 RepID=UPI0037A3DCC3